MRKRKPNGIATPAAWRAASQAEREARAEPLRLPSGATILAVKPDPLEWIMSGRIPQKLLGAALESDRPSPADAEREISREEILELAKFATQLVKASIIEPRVGEGPGEIGLDEIPIEDRAFIFEWACRALGQSGEKAPRRGDDLSMGTSTEAAHSRQEDLSSDKLERFCQK